ncbi:MAG TPA: YihY/virulence factor BrkB family protein [Pyrinomonadaceae bacterium]|nr:YihY/virulence factor BrkB family protein [Pyrinomonadaceae bacterium]
MRRQPSFSRASFGVRNKAPWLTMLGHALHQFHENDLFTSAAAMSYFGLLTLFPGLILLLALGKHLAAGSDVLNEMLRRVLQVYPGSGEFLDATIRSLSDLSVGIIITCIIVVFWAGSWVFAVVERAVNRIWNCSPRAFLRGRALTLGMVGIVGLLLIVSVLFTSLLVTVREIAVRLSPRQLERWTWLAAFGGMFWQIVLTLASILITIVLFMLIYRFMPNSRVTLRDSIPGAIIGGLLWEAAKYIFAWSLHYFHYDQLYGSVGAVVAVLTWGYVSSLILLFGAQLTAVFHREHPAEPVKPSAADATIAPMQ